MAELEEYLRKGKNCTLTEGMIQKILEIAQEYGNYEWQKGYDEVNDLFNPPC